MTNAFIFAFNHIRTTLLRQRIKPRVLQMPITGRCNSRCATCNIWKNQTQANDIDAVALKQALTDTFFSQVRVVGINGGEPSLYRDIDSVIDALFVLPKLNRVHVISNALIEHRLTSMMERIKSRCAERGIVVYLTISVDGVEGVHNTIRGLHTAFDKTIATIQTIKQQKERYCDVLDIGTTISNQNIEYIVQIEEFNKSLGIPAYYHPAVPNKRLSNFSKGENFDIMTSERSRLLAAEYFFGKFKYGSGLRTRLRAFLTYHYLKNGGEGRLAGCNYLRSDVTITENLDLCLCATASDRVGSLKEAAATQLLKSGAMKKEELRVKNHCDGCVHYIIFPSVKGFILFCNELLAPEYGFLIY